MPQSFQPNDDGQPIADQPLTRGNYGLPEGAPVFCSFNQGFKIEPILFGLWMDLLRALPGSALWLPASSPEILANLRREAGERSVDPGRLVFADRPPKELHLKRLALADLALDTRLYNGHTTTSDALWAGVPVVTLLGEHFASRVSASVLHAIGLPELIATSLEDYRAIALRYARDPALLGALRRKLAANRKTEPLFETARYVRALERGYRAMWRRHAAGAEPANILVEDDG
jgi:predicted O-linked N-acetylglucosamine transferase (SPINDLY family)